jgi:hypothetical protein
LRVAKDRGLDNNINTFTVDDYPVTSKQFRGVKEKNKKTINPLDLKTF